MTPEERATEAAMLKFPPDILSNGKDCMRHNREVYAEAYLTGWNAAKVNCPQWVKASDRLPEINSRVPYKYVFNGVTYFDGGYFGISPHSKNLYFNGSWKIYKEDFKTHGVYWLSEPSNK